VWWDRIPDANCSGVKSQPHRELTQLYYFMFVYRLWNIIITSLKTAWTVQFGYQLFNQRCAVP